MKARSRLRPKLMKTNSGFRSPCTTCEIEFMGHSSGKSHDLRIAVQISPYCFFNRSAIGLPQPNSVATSDRNGCFSLALTKPFTATSMVAEWLT